MDPLRPGGFVPLSEEWFHQQKKLLKQSGVDKTSASESANDVYMPSEAAQELPATDQERFLESARTSIMELDPGSEGFVPEATSRLVDSCLGQVFGEQIASNPGYPQMQAKITGSILGDSRYREVVEDFLEVLVASECRRLENGTGDSQS